MADIQLIRGSNGNGPAVRPVVTAARLSGSLTIKVNSTTNLPSSFIGTWGKLNQDTGKLISSSIRDFYGTVNGADIDLVRMADGFTDDGNEVGDVIVIKPNTDWANNLADVLEVSHNPDGTIKSTYSTSEQVVGKWIDGKPIYGRVFTGTITHVGGDRRFLNLVSNADSLIRASGWFIGSDGSKHYLGGTAGNNDLTSVYHFSYIVVENDNRIRIATRSDNDRSNSPYQYYLEYTKI